MKYNRVTLLLFCFFLCIALVGCTRPMTNKEKVELIKNTISTLKDENKPSESTTNQGMQGIFNQIIENGGITKKGWPKDKVSEQVLEYPFGKVINSGGSKEELIILVEETTKEERDKYLNELEKTGWYVNYHDSNPSASKDNLKLSFQFNSKNLLQIIVYTSTYGKWPADKLPPDIVPPDDGQLIGEVYVEKSQDGKYEKYYITADYNGIDIKMLEKYVNKMIKLGWEGDTSMLNKTFEWNKKVFDASITFDFYDGRTTLIIDVYQYIESNPNDSI